MNHLGFSGWLWTFLEALLAVLIMVWGALVLLLMVFVGVILVCAFIDYLRGDK